jgi:1,2-diacylglycerol 3-beta-glucosyltransferase
VLGRVRPARPVGPAGPRFRVMIVIPCLNEGRVIAATVASVLAHQCAHAVSVLVIDDGSDDDTSEQLAPYVADTRVSVLHRRLPTARQGKGKALNEAYRILRARRWNHDKVLVCILDADGRLQPGAIDRAVALFADPQVGAVQIGVRIRNAGTNLLARLQDVEFLVYTEVYQRGRNRLESVGLGGNGQFARLRALMDLGDEPWSECLTEDLDLGVRLMLAGHRNRYCPQAVVDQQGVTDVRRFVRQRTRWFQGHLQCWALLPRVLRSSLPRRARADLTLQLTSPFQLLAASIAITSSWALGLVEAVTHIEHPGQVLLGPAGMVTFLVAFVPSPLIAWIYWQRQPEIGYLRGLLIAHLFVLYTCLWFAAGWRAVGRTVRKQRSWAKTARVVEAVSPAPLAIPVPVTSRRAS